MKWVSDFRDTPAQYRWFSGGLRGSVGLKPVGPPVHYLHSRAGKLYGFVCIFPGMLSDFLLCFLLVRCHLYIREQIWNFKWRTSVLDLETHKSIVTRYTITVMTDMPSRAGWAALKMQQQNFQGSLASQIATRAPPWPCLAPTAGWATTASLLLLALLPS